MDSSYVIAAWFQPIENFELLKSLGFNTLIGMDLQDTHTRGQWIAAAGIMGFKLVLNPGPSGVPVTLEDGNPNVIGWLLMPDEPNGQGNKTPGDMLGVSAWWSQQTKKALHLSLDGPAIVWGRQFADYLTYASCARVVWEDVYPANNGVALAEKLLRVDLVKAACAMAGSNMANPPVAGSFIECCNQELAWRGTAAAGPTPVMIAQQVEACLARGVQWYCWFLARDSSSPNHYKSINCTPEQLQAVKQANARIVSYRVAVPASKLPPLNVAINAAGYKPTLAAVEPL